MLKTQSTDHSQADSTVEIRRTVYVRGLELAARIGAYEHEIDTPQPIRVEFELDVSTPDNPVSDSIEDVVCYDRMSRGVRDIVNRGHIKLVETLAEQVAAFALSHPMVRAATVRVEKLTAVTGATAAGVEIRREKA